MYYREVIFMARLELVRCRLAIQCCIGHFPDGRERHRTFSLQDVRPDASADALASVIRAVAPLLAYPITKVSIVKKYVLVLDAVTLQVPQTFRDQGTSVLSEEGAFYTEEFAPSGSRFTPRPDVFVLIMAPAYPNGTGSRARALPPWTSMPADVSIT